MYRGWKSIKLSSIIINTIIAKIMFVAMFALFMELISCGFVKNFNRNDERKKKSPPLYPSNNLHAQCSPTDWLWLNSINETTPLTSKCIKHIIIIGKLLRNGKITFEKSQSISMIRHWNYNFGEQCTVRQTFNHKLSVLFEAIARKTPRWHHIRHRTHTTEKK